MSEENVPAPTATEILFGGCLIDLHLEDGTPTQVKLRQLPLKDYEKAFRVIEDEFAFTTLVCGQVAGWGETLSPDSHQRLMAEIERVNQSFFEFADRKTRRAMAQVAMLPPQMTEKLMAEVIAKTSLRSPASSPPFRRGVT